MSDETTAPDGPSAAVVAGPDGPSAAVVAEPSSAFLRACHRLSVPHVPVWFMRQAGRSLPEYRAVRGSGSILDALLQPELAAEITLQPLRRYGVDAAIVYSDIVAPVWAIGFGVDVAPGIGPVIAEPFRGPADLARLRPLEADLDMPWLAETIQIVTKETTTPLIGFAGAPFTVASYLIEGRPSKTYALTKSLMHSDPSTWSALTSRLADLAVATLTAQVAAGATAVQLFDSWAGALHPDDYRRHVLPATTSIFERLAHLGVPRIHFGVGTGEILALMGDAGADVVGVDWRVPLDEARRRVGPERAVQGNLDPAMCLAPWDVVRAQALRVLDEAGPAPGHIFNLGHGVFPETDPDILSRVVDLVHEHVPGSPS